jgi:4-amino-4-deoxychorismate lyase
VKFILDRKGGVEVEFGLVPNLPLEALFPSTLNLPSEDEIQVEPPTPFQPSPLTGGALTMGPTDYQPVPPTTSKICSSLKRTYTILLDSQPTPYNAHTIYKTTYRPHYDKSRSRVLTPDPTSELAEEVLLYNSDGQIMEGSITTPYFFRNGRWVTPPVWEVHHGGQRGATRRYALERRLCISEAVSVESLKDGEKVWISSGVQGFRWGLLEVR